MQFQKQHLDGTHYRWSENEGHFFIGEPSRRNFDRFNGNQVLFLINYYGSMADRFTVDRGKCIEKSIQYDLPEEARSEISVFKWIWNTDFSEK